MLCKKVSSELKIEVGPFKDAAGRVIENDVEAANLLNDYFASSVFTKENCSNIRQSLRPFSKEKWKEEGLLNF